MIKRNRIQHINKLSIFKNLCKKVYVKIRELKTAVTQR